MDAMIVIAINMLTSPIGTTNLAPSTSLEISRKINHDCKTPRNIPTIIPKNVMNDDSIKNWILIMLDLNPIALSTPIDCLRSTTALTADTPCTYS